jgi:hypothetical protein
MDWINKNINSGEEVVYQTHQHWSLFLLPLAGIVLSTIKWWILIPSIVLLSYYSFIFLTHQYVVTNQRFIQKKGLYYIRIKDWPIHKIEEVICTKTIFDRIKGSGSVILMGIAIPKSYLRGVDSPKELRDAIYGQLPAK